MVELTAEQLRVVSEATAGPTRLRDPRTNETFVLIRLDEYKKLTLIDYDDSPWTREELGAIAHATADRAARDGEGENRVDRPVAR